MEEQVKKLPRGLRNNNPLNIRVGSTWKGETSKNTDGAFEQFESMRYGMRAGLKLLRNYISGFEGKRRPVCTPRDIISRWAPPSENATQRYVSIVVQRTGLNAAQHLFPNDRKTICRLAQAMAFVECGQELPIEDWQAAWDLI